MNQPSASSTGGLTCLGKLVVLAFILASFAGAYFFLLGGRNPFGANPAQPGGTATSPGPAATNPAVTAGTAPTVAPPGPTSFSGNVQLGIAYGTEKEKWLKWAVQQFEQTPDGQKIRINLIPMGSLEGAQAILAGKQTIHVWSPASAIYRDTFVTEWDIKYGGQPIEKEAPLALSPMVFVFWDERYQSFIARYKTVSFKTVGEALAEKGGWEGIANKPEWGLFKFGHTHPNQSNSGLATLLLMAHEYHNKPRRLEVPDIANAGFQSWMQNLERSVSGLSHSTGTMMREMILKGPSSYDAMFVYENVAIEQLRNAQGRWGALRVAYPALNLWNDNPYYIINAPWCTAEHKQAASIFLDFLLSDPIQAQALTHGFRPANVNVPVKGDQSPFTQYQQFGLSIDLATVVEAPKAEVIHNLLTSWQRSQGNR